MKPPSLLKLQKCSSSQVCQGGCQRSDSEGLEFQVFRLNIGIRRYRINVNPNQVRDVDFCGTVIRGLWQNAPPPLSFVAASDEDGSKCATANPNHLSLEVMDDTDPIPAKAAKIHSAIHSRAM